ncbi:hypothetical protein BZA70DRAFT_83295 [Myxozyma melibiosi]|uniref:Uncharacterized protein n=1 Tax=Myxozyma melibiosi TaxID=54550 RepID=A0ABR1EZW6_9ASCO
MERGGGGGGGERRRRKKREGKKKHEALTEDLVHGSQDGGLLTHALHGGESGCIGRVCVFLKSAHGESDERVKEEEEEEERQRESEVTSERGRIKAQGRPPTLPSLCSPHSVPLNSSALHLLHRLSADRHRLLLISQSISHLLLATQPALSLRFCCSLLHSKQYSQRCVLCCAVLRHGCVLYLLRLTVCSVKIAVVYSLTVACRGIDDRYRTDDSLSAVSFLGVLSSRNCC